MALLVVNLGGKMGNGWVVVVGGMVGDCDGCGRCGCLWWVVWEGEDRWFLS